MVFYEHYFPFDKQEQQSHLPLPLPVDDDIDQIFPNLSSAAPRQQQSRSQDLQDPSLSQSPNLVPPQVTTAVPPIMQSSSSQQGLPIPALTSLPQYPQKFPYQQEG